MTKTAEELLDERTHDVMAYAYRDTDGKLYTVNKDGELIEAAANAKPLSPKYQEIAEKTAAVVMSYNKILSLDTEQRGFFADIMNGKRPEIDAAGTKVGELVDEAKKLAGFEMPGAGIISGLSNIGSGFTFLPTLLADIASGMADVGEQIGGGQLKKKDAIAIGTSYASAREVVASGRPLNPGAGDFFSGLFSKHFGAYAGAGLAWLFDCLMGFAEHIPGIGEWIKKQGWAKHETLSQHIEKHSRGSDNQHVQDEMGELKKIGGRGAKETAALLTLGGTGRDSAGNETTINPAGIDNAAPQDPNNPNAPADPAAAEAEANKNKKDFLERAKNAFAGAFEASKEVLAETSTAGLAVGGTGFVLATGQTVRGVGEGVNGTAFNKIERTAVKAKDDFIKANAKFDKATAAGPRVDGWKVWQKTQAQIDALKVSRDALDAEAKAARTVADAAKLNATSTVQHALDPMKGGILKSPLWNSWRHLGRGLGIGGYEIVTRLDSLVDNIASGIKSKGTSVFSGIKNAAYGVVEGAGGVVNGTTLAPSVSGVNAVARNASWAASHGIKIFEPTVAGVKTINAIGTGDNASFVAHGTETATMALSMFKLGTKGAIPALTPISSTAELGLALYNGDKAGAKSAVIDLGIVGGGATIGAGIIAVTALIASAPISVPALLVAGATGATVGGFAVAGRSLYNTFAVPEAKAATIPQPAKVAGVGTVPTAPAVAGALGTPDAKLAAVAIAQNQQTQAAWAAATRATPAGAFSFGAAPAATASTPPKLAFNNVKDVHPGGFAPSSAGDASAGGSRAVNAGAAPAFF